MHPYIIISICLQTWRYHYENKPIQIYWKFYRQKLKNFK